MMGQRGEAPSGGAVREKQHYLNESTFNELLISRKKAMIDLREDHLSRCVRSREVGGQR